MLNSFEIDGRVYRIDDYGPVDISIPLDFNGPQPNAYGVEPAVSKACEAGDLVGDTRRGGSCNFEQYTFIPHCNGTHTECVGHITHERISILDCLSYVPVSAALITIDPVIATESGETYSMEFADTDRVISRRTLEASLKDLQTHSALIIRTTPNNAGKLTQRYIDHIPPYFTNDAIGYIVELGIEHLVVDLPSIDRLHDEGRLSNHRLFWNVEPGSFELKAESRVDATITEFAYIPNGVLDGAYLLNLQIAPFDSDASPSRPVLFPIIEK